MRRLVAAAALALAACGGGDDPAAPAPGSNDDGACPAPLTLAPLISAHRGGSAYAPENTLTAFANAVRLGVDELEMDTQLTADGELVVIHDATLDRTTECSGAVQDHSLAEVEACDAAYWFTPGQNVTAPAADAPHPLRGSGVRVPTLRAVLDWYGTLPCARPRLSIEIKNIPREANFDPVGETVAQKLVPLLADYGVVDRTLVQSFWPLTLDAVKRLNPALRTQFLTTSSTGQTAAQNLAYVIARGHDIAAPNFDAPDFDLGLVTAAHAAGKQVIPYTIDRASDAAVVAGLGVDAMITNFPACVADVLHRTVPAKVTPDGVPGLPACPPGDATALPSMQDRPSAETCAALRAQRWLPATGHAAPNAKLRVVGLQYKQDVRFVDSYDSYRTKMRCLVEDHVVPLLQPGLPLLAVFNEDAGLATLAIGTRGAAVRAQAGTPLRGPAGDQAPLGIAAALGMLNAAYAPQIAAYQARFGPIDPRKQVFVGATDTFARAVSQTFSDIARDYGIYVVASNNQPEYVASRDPFDLLVFADPDLPAVEEVYVATSPRVTNRTMLWGPQDLHPDAPRGETNLLFANDKVPLTDIELTLIALDEGAATGDAARVNAAGFEVAGFRLGFATSLPAFQWGYDFGTPRPGNVDPCADVHNTYMVCMDALGVDVVIQAEANPGRWAIDQAGGWQPLEWMDSTWRTVADAYVKFRYNVTPMMTGNLLDLPFDGQSAITVRNGSDAPAHYVGNTEFAAGVDPQAYAGFVGGKAEFAALAPWVTADAPRDALRATGAALSPGSNDPLENDYLETAVWADLTR